MRYIDYEFCPARLLSSGKMYFLCVERIEIMDHTKYIIKADTIEQYNPFFRVRDTPPVGGIVHFDASVPQPTHRMTLGFYALFLKKTTGCVINYGKTRYDFDDETVVSFARDRPSASTDWKTVPHRKPSACCSIPISCTTLHWGSG